MSINFNVTNEEKSYLRELSKKYLEYANHPIMEERKSLWYAHNSLKSPKPLIVVEHFTFEDDLLTGTKCKTPAAKEIERQLFSAIVNFELVGDDKVISPYYVINWNIKIQQFGLSINREYAEDSQGKKLGFNEKHPISDLEKDFSLLNKSIYSVDREYTFRWKEFVEELIGDILPVKIKNNSLQWHIAPSQRAVELMGLETMMYSMIDYPDQMNELYKFISNDIMEYVHWQEKEGLLTLNNENDFAGAGSYGFTSELPTENCNETGRISPKDLWLNMNSQETVGISPEMFGEFVFPYYQNLAKEFGLVYYGCCEPVHNIWEDYISKLPGLRKVSISPWCNEEIMGEYLRKSSVIYSRKPSPNFVGVEGSFDTNAFSDHIAKTLKAAKGCELEIIFRDIYTLSGDISKPGKAVQITRNLIDKLW
jgi:hypothetical protein